MNQVLIQNQEMKILNFSEMEQPLNNQQIKKNNKMILEVDTSLSAFLQTVIKKLIPSK